MCDEWYNSNCKSKEEINDFFEYFHFSVYSLETRINFNIFKSLKMMDKIKMAFDHHKDEKEPLKTEDWLAA